MKKWLLKVLVLIMIIALPELAYAQGQEWLFKNHNNFKTGMIVFGVLGLILLLWEVSFQLSSLGGKAKEAKISIVETSAPVTVEDEDDPIKSLLKSQVQKKVKEKIEEDESVLPSFLDEEIEEQVVKETPRPLTTSSTVSTVQKKEEVDPFKMLLQKTETEKVTKQESISFLKPSVSSKQVEKEKEEDPFKALLKASKEVHETIPSPAASEKKMRRIELSPAGTEAKPTAPLKQEASIEIQRKEEEAPLSKGKLSIGFPQLGQEDISKISIKVSEPEKLKHEKRLFARLNKTESPEDADLSPQEEATSFAAPAPSVKAKPTAMLGEDKIKITPVIKTLPDKKASVKIPQDDSSAEPSSLFRKKVLSLEIPLKEKKKSQDSTLESSSPKSPPAEGPSRLSLKIPGKTKEPDI